MVENRKLRVVVTNEFGARIISLIYKPTETEYAWHNPRIPVKKPNYEIDFEDPSGFFNCLPTTQACTFKGMELPAGGEVASEPWALLSNVSDNNSVTLKMERSCKIYPMLIHKQISIRGDEPIIHLSYQVDNLSDKHLEYHYSSHNTLQITPYHRFVLPHEVSKLRLEYSATGHLGNTGVEVSWPKATDREGKTLDLSKMPDSRARVAESLYTPKLGEAWCAVINGARKEAIGFSWSGDVLPYLLLWIDGGGWRDYYHAALEPVTGRPDNLEVAVNDWKEYATLAPRGTSKWNETIILGHNIENIERIENDSMIN